MMVIKSCLSVSAVYCYLFYLINSTTLFPVDAQLGIGAPLTSAVPQDVNGIQLGIHCDGSRTGTFRTGIVTVEAAPAGSDIQILTNPPDLVTASVDDQKFSPQGERMRYLRLEYKSSVAGALGVGLVGVHIIFPSDRLEGLWMCCQSQGQLVGNFPSLRNVEVTGGAQLLAGLTGEVSDDLLLTAKGEKTNLYVSYEGGTIRKLIARDFAYAEVTAMKILEVDINSSAKAMIDVVVPPGGTIESSGDSSTSSIDISSVGGCKRIIATTVAKCTDGVVMDLKDVNYILADVSNWVVEGETETCSRDQELSSSGDSELGLKGRSTNKGGKDGGNGAVVGIVVVVVIICVVVLAVLAWVAWRMYHGEPVIPLKQDEEVRRQQKHDLEAPLPIHHRGKNAKSKTKQDPTNKKKKPSGQDHTMSETSMREDENVVLPASPYNKKRSIAIPPSPPPKKSSMAIPPSSPPPKKSSIAIPPSSPPPKKRNKSILPSSPPPKKSSLAIPSSPPPKKSSIAIPPKKRNNTNKPNVNSKKQSHDPKRLGKKPRPNPKQNNPKN